MKPIPHAPRVLVFDSGVGSLSIGAEIHRLLPDLDLLYAMDRGGFPYGQWQEQPLAEHICRKILDVLIDHPCDMVVVACNSASTAVLPSLRSQVAIPVVGVVPAIKPAAQQSSSGVIGLLATPGTISRPYTAQLIADFASHCHVITAGDPGLASAVETFFWRGENSPSAWRQAIMHLAEKPRFAEMDTVVLACTHFPLVQQQLAKELTLLGKEVSWIDSGQAIARRVAQLLNESGTTRELKQTGSQEALLLGEPEDSDSLAAVLKNRGIRLLSGR